MNARTMLAVLLSLMLMFLGSVITACETGGTHPDPAVRRRAMEKTVNNLNAKNDDSQR